MFSKKKIVLNSAVNDNKKGIVEIIRLDNLTHLSIKIGNFIPNKNSRFIFLLKNNGIQQRFFVDNPRNFECDVDTPIDLDKKISCLLIENEQQPIFWGGTETRESTMNSMLPMESKNEKQINAQNTKCEQQECCSFNKTIDDDVEINNIDANFDNNTAVFTQDNYNFESENQFENCSECNNLKLHKIDLADILFDESNVEKDIDQALNQFEIIEKKEEEPSLPQCINCKYKNHFFAEQSLHEVKDELQKIKDMQNLSCSEIAEEPLLQERKNGEPNELVKEEIFEKDLQQVDEPTKEPYYFSLIKSQYESMFEKYPAFEKLSQIIENSKWIEVDGIDDPYIMGIIYENAIPRYLCYGIFQERKQSPPLDIVDSSQWVPFDADDELGQGVWLLYQSAENGETLQIDIV